VDWVHCSLKVVERALSGILSWLQIIGAFLHGGTDEENDALKSLVDTQVSFTSEEQLQNEGVDFALKRLLIPAGLA
jgi:hypothetical protein